MINAKWQVEGFKAISFAEIDLGKELTILTGQNSSGKTSITQTLLLLRQSEGSEISLNGPLVRLGGAKDVIQSGRQPYSAKSGFQIAMGLPDGHTVTLTISSSVSHASGNFRDAMTQRVQVSSLEVAEAEGRLTLESERPASITGDQQDILKYADGSESISVLKVKARGLPSKSRSYIVYDGFSPVALVRFMSQTNIKKLANQLAQHLEDLLSNDSGRGRSFWPRAAMMSGRGRESIFSREDDVDLVFNNFLRKPSAETKATVVDKFVSHYSSNPVIYELQPSISHFSNRYRKSPFERLREEDEFVSPSVLAARNLILTFATQIEKLIEFGSLIQRLQKRIEYIGPLRDDPRVTWEQWSTGIPGLPLGFKGEQTASYYSQHYQDKKKAVQGPEGVPKSASLRRHVESWMSYLGIGSSLVPVQFGKTGVGLEVGWSGSTRDLTSLGVGVSQAVPIIVAGLAAKGGSVLIVEQPELHLHPDVQARLADFFLFSRPDVKFIVETHSDHIITRIRRRVAEGHDKSKIQLIFVESESSKRDYVSGHQKHPGSVGYEIKFTELGDLSEWPEGFISGSLEDADAILSAVLDRGE